MARGSRTSKIPRATSRLGRRKKGRAGKAGRVSRAIADRTRPTPRSERLIPRLLGRTALGIGLLVILASFVNSFLLAPGRTWFGQRDEISAREAELATIQQANDELQKDIDRLLTPVGIEDAAREELGYVMAGEERQTIIGEAEAPLELPAGWPYDLVTRIVGVREAQAAAEAAGNTAENTSDSTVDNTTSTAVGTPADPTPTSLVPVTSTVMTPTSGG